MSRYIDTLEVTVVSTVRMTPLDLRDAFENLYGNNLIHVHTVTVRPGEIEVVCKLEDLAEAGFRREDQHLWETELRRATSAMVRRLLGQWSTEDTHDVAKRGTGSAT